MTPSKLVGDGVLCGRIFSYVMEKTWEKES